MADPNKNENNRRGRQEATSAARRDFWEKAKRIFGKRDSSKESKNGDMLSPEEYLDEAVTDEVYSYLPESLQTLYLAYKGYKSLHQYTWSHMMERQLEEGEEEVENENLNLMIRRGGAEKEIPALLERQQKYIDTLLQQQQQQIAVVAAGKKREEVAEEMKGRGTTFFSYPCSNAGNATFHESETWILCTNDKLFTNEEYNSSPLFPICGMDCTPDTCECCVSVAKVVSCDCLPGRKDKFCSEWEPYQCLWKLVFPERLSCDVTSVIRTDSHYAMDPKCSQDIYFPRDEDLDLSYLLDCEFEDTAFQNFSSVMTTYSPDNKVIAKGYHQPYNFWKIYDTSYQAVLDITTNQLAGEESIHVHLKTTSLPEKYFAGDRLYIETGFSELRRYEWPSGLTKQQLAKHFIDFEPTYYLPNVSNNNISSGGIVGIVIAVLLGVVTLIGFGYGYHWKRSSKQQQRRARGDSGDRGRNNPNTAATTSESSSST